jgi:glutamate--cysteine ligase
MMWRTASVQSNFDYESEEDALRKLRVSLRLAPIVSAMTANSPFREGRRARTKSARALAWLHMDPERSGLIPPLWEAKRASYRDYVEWALDAGMFLIVRGDQIVANTGQTFRSFLQHGYLGHRATVADWKLHLNTLFPEVRLRHTVEVRCSDALPATLACAVPALFAGIFYDQRALDQAGRLALRLDFAQLTAARPELARNGLNTVIGTSPVRALAEDLLDIAAAGLQRRARCNAEGRDERVFLQPLERLVDAGKSPADLLLAGLPDGDSLQPTELIERTRW